MGERAIIFTNRLRMGFGLRGRSKNQQRIRKSTIHYRKQTLAALWLSRRLSSEKENAGAMESP